MKNYIIILLLFVLYHANGQTVTFSKAGICASTGVEVMGDVYYGISWSGSGICIGKFDTLGNTISIQNYPTIQWLYYAPKLVSSLDGHLAIVSTRNDSLGLRGILVDFDTSGGIISETVLTIPNVGTDSIAPYDLASTKDSGYIVVSSVSYLGYPKIGVVKMDKNKNNQWEVLLPVYNGYSSTGPIPDVCTDKDGGYLVSYQWDYCDATYDCWSVSCNLVKLDSAGNTVWTWSHSGSNLRVKGGNDMTKTKDGGWAVASAALREPNTGGGVSPTPQCGYVFKIDSAQNLLWSKRLEGLYYSWYDKTARIIELEDSSLVTFGTVTDSIPWNAQKGYVYKLSADGDSIWSRQYYHLQSNVRHEMLDAEKLPDGGFLVSGARWVGSGGWLLKLDKHGCLVPGCHLPLGVLPTGAVEDFRLSLYPNPTTDYLNVFYQSKKLGNELTFSVVDIQGRELQNYTTADVSDETYIVPVHDLVAGVYILEVRRNGQLLKSEQFIKQ